MNRGVRKLSAVRKGGLHSTANILLLDSSAYERLLLYSYRCSIFSEAGWLWVTSTQSTCTAVHQYVCMYVV